MVGVDKKAVGGMWTVVENYLNDIEFCNDVSLIYVPTATSASFLGKIIFSIVALAKVLYILIFNNIDIVHVHMAEKGSVFREGIVVVLGKLFRTKVIIHMHGATFEQWYIGIKSIFKKLVSWIINKCDIFLILGEYWRDFTESIVKENFKIKVIHNAVVIPNENNYNEKSLDIIFLGMLIERKGIDDLLKAIKNIKDYLPVGVKVKLYGSDKNNNINRKIKELGLEDIVEYLGWLTLDNKNECFSKAMLNILPSYNEGLPMTILETMAYGIPNIATNIAAIPEAISNNEDGILVEPGDVDSLGKEILKLVNNLELRSLYSKKAFEKVKDEFDIKIHINNLKKIYSELLYVK